MRAFSVKFADVLTDPPMQAHCPNFTRHLRRKTRKEGGVWAADAVYSKSPTMSDGPAGCDANVAVMAREEKRNTDGVRTYG